MIHTKNKNNFPVIQNFVKVYQVQDKNKKKNNITSYKQINKYYNMKYLYTGKNLIKRERIG